MSTEATTARARNPKVQAWLANHEPRLFINNMVGTLGLKAKLPDRTIVFTGDAAHKRASIDMTVGIPLDVHSADKNDALRKLNLLRTQPNTTVWVNHDPDDWTDNRPGGRQIL